MMGFGMGLGLLLLLAIAGALIVGAVWLARSVLGKGTQFPGSATAGGPDSAIDILDQRYARGELSRDEYELMRADLHL